MTKLQAKLTRILSSLACIGAISFSSSAQVYKDPSAPVDRRVEDLMSRMTLEEKVAQMCMTGLGDVARES